MKNPTPRSLAVIAALLPTLFVFFFWYFLNAKFVEALCVACVNFLLIYIATNYAISYFIYRKIKVIYKTIFDLKSTKSASITSEIALNTSDPIEEANREVVQWAEARSAEIAQLRDMEAYRKEFFGNVSHELKTPIFNMQGYIHTLLDTDLDDPDLVRRFLTKAARSADRMEVLVKDLLTITELESGAVHLDLEVYDIYEQVVDVFESLELLAAERNIVMGFKPGFAPPFLVQADKKRIRQVLVNLIVNAIKYGKKNGQVQIGIYDMDSNFLVEVSDNGEGIEQEHLNRLFERFYRIDKARSRQEGGSGLGLSIVKHIVEAHSQTIHVRSSVGVGSTFSFTIKKN